MNSLNLSLSIFKLHPSCFTVPLSTYFCPVSSWSSSLQVRPHTQVQPCVCKHACCKASAPDRAVQRYWNSPGFVLGHASFERAWVYDHSRVCVCVFVCYVSVLHTNTEKQNPTCQMIVWVVNRDFIGTAANKRICDPLWPSDYEGRGCRRLK